MGIGFRKDLKLVRGLEVPNRHHQPTTSMEFASGLSIPFNLTSSPDLKNFARSEWCPAWWYSQYYQKNNNTYHIIQPSSGRLVLHLATGVQGEPGVSGPNQPNHARILEINLTIFYFSLAQPKG